MQEIVRLEQKEKLTITHQKRTFSNLNDRLHARLWHYKFVC